MIPAFRTVPVSAFRRDMATHLDFVAREGGHVWLRHHRRHVAGIVPMAHVKLIEEFESKTAEQKRRETEMLVLRWEQMQASRR